MSFLASATHIYKILNKEAHFPIIFFSKYFLSHASSKLFFPGPVPDRRVKFAKQD